MDSSCVCIILLLDCHALAFGLSCTVKQLLHSRSMIDHVYRPCAGISGVMSLHCLAIS